MTGGEWRDWLAAAREPPTREQRAWDWHWLRWWHAAIRNGRTPNAAAQVAQTRTEDQYGLRPDDTPAT